MHDHEEVSYGPGPCIHCQRIPAVLISRRNLLYRDEVASAEDVRVREALADWAVFRARVDHHSCLATSWVWWAQALFGCKGSENVLFFASASQSFPEGELKAPLVPKLK